MSVLRRLRLQDINVTNTLTCDGVANLSSLSVTGNSDLSGTLTVSEDATLNKRLLLQGQLLAASSATFSNQVTISGPLSSTAAATFTSSVDVQGTLSVDGASSLGATECASLSVAGNSTIGGSLAVTGASTLSSTLTTSGAASFGEDVHVSGSLSANGASSFGDSLTVGGALTTTGAATFQSSVALTDQLTVGGQATFQSNASVGAALTVGGQTTIQGALQVNDDATVTGALEVHGNVHHQGNLTVEGDVSVQGSLITKHQEQVFVGDSHFVINAGGSSVGSSSSGITFVYQIDAVLAANSQVTFNGDASVTGRLTLPPGSPAISSAYADHLVSVSGASPYDGIYLLDLSDTSAPRLYSTDGNGVDWTTRIPFLNSVAWGAGASVTTLEQFPNMTVSVVRVSHLQTDSAGGMWWARGAEKSDFWSGDVSNYARVGMDGGTSTFKALSSSGVVEFAVTALAVPGITATLSATDKLGTTRKIINNSGGDCLVVAPPGVTIDGLNTYELEDQEYIIVTKYEAQKYAII